MMMTTNHLQMFSGNNAQCPINENFSFSIALVQNMLVTHLGRPSLNPRLMSERNLPPAQNLEDARFIRASCVLGGGGVKGSKRITRNTSVVFLHFNQPYYVLDFCHIVLW